MANYEATRYDYDGSNITGIEGVNTGIIVPWSDTSTPSGFLTCDGSAVSRTTYADLFAVVGTNYGSGDGSTTFNLPNLTDRTAVGKSPTKSQYSTGGANSVTSTGNLGGGAGNTTLTTPQLPVHNHPVSGRAGQPRSTRMSSSGSCAGQGSGPTGNAGSDGAHGHNMAGNFTGGDDSVLQPYVTIKYIIKT